MYLKLVTKVSYYVAVTMETIVQRRVHLSMKRVFIPKTRDKSRASTLNIVTETNEVDKNSQDLLDIYHLNYKPISTYQSQYLRV